MGIKFFSQLSWVFVFGFCVCVGVPAQACVSNLPAFGHVFVVVEENLNYDQVIGNLAAAPYLNSLALRYGLSTQYYANTHPSIGNYFMMTVGQVVTNDSAFTGKVTDDNIVRQLLLNGKTWKSYAESLPSVGYTGEGPYPYARRHNPFSYLSDVIDSPSEINNLVPFSQFATDLISEHLASYSFIVPNLVNDGHDGTLSQVDTWLSTNIEPLIQSSTFQRDGLLIILYDEGSTDNTHGGGRIMTLIISPKGRDAYQSNHFYQHENILALTSRALGLCSPPGAAAQASDMSEFFIPPTLSDSVHSIKISPNPFIPSQGHQLITLSNLPSNVSIRILGLAGELMMKLDSNDEGIAQWDASNQSGETVASGVYFVLAEGRGGKAVTKLAIQR